MAALLSRGYAEKSLILGALGESMRKLGTLAAALSAVILSGCTPVWNGDMSTGDFSQFYRVNACPGHATVVSATGRSGNAAKLDVQDTDHNCPLAYGANRADLLSQPVLQPGGEYWIRWSTYFPSTFPTNTGSTWLQIAELYGPPFGGSPPVGIYAENGKLEYKRDRNHGYDTVWTGPLPRGGWADFILHVRMGSSGFVELWFNNVRQTFTNGSQRLSYATMASGVNDGGANWLDTDLYRSASVPLGDTWVEHAQMGIAKP